MLPSSLAVPAAGAKLYALWRRTTPRGLESYQKAQDVINGRK